MLEKVNENEDLVKYCVKYASKEIMSMNKSKEDKKIIENALQKYKGISKEGITQIYFICKVCAIKLPKEGFGFYPYLLAFKTAGDPEVDVYMFEEFIILRARKDISKGKIISISNSSLNLFN